jgi:hypothetical protein
MHEIRNSLQALNNLLYLGLKTADEPELVRQHIRLAQEQAATLNEITSSTLGRIVVSLDRKCLGAGC